jgi:DNA-binding transcriptional LysR family regulator
LLNHELDVAVIARELVLSGFHALAFATDSLVAIAQKGSAWERRRSIAVEELKRQVLVCREPGASSRSALDRLIDTTRMPPSQLVQIGSREGVISAVAEGMGLGIIFDDQMLPDRRVVKLSIRGPVITSTDEIACLAERRTSQVISAFLGIAQEYIEERRSPMLARLEMAKDNGSTSIGEESSATQPF